VTTLAQAYVNDIAESVKEVAADALRSLPAGPAREALCRLAVEQSSEALLAIAREAGYLPGRAAPAGRAARTQWPLEELQAFDLDGTHLRIAYGAATADVRRRIAAAARQAGRTDWVQIAIGGRQRRRLAEMTRDEWQNVIDILSRDDCAADIWRLAQDAPPFWPGSCCSQ